MSLSKSSSNTVCEANVDESRERRSGTTDSDSSDNFNDSFTDILPRCDTDFLEPRILGQSKRLGEFRVLNRLSKGSFGVVYRARDTANDVDVAVKIIFSVPVAFRVAQESREFEIMRQLDHPNVMKVLSCKQRNHLDYIFLELAERGSLLSVVEKNHPLPKSLIRNYFAQLIDGLAYLHGKKRLRHGDIKLENLVLTASDEVKICDFGLAILDTVQPDPFATGFGTRAFMPPEYFRDKVPHPSYAGDMWAAGMCLYGMRTNRFPWQVASAESCNFSLYAKRKKLPTDDFACPKLKKALKMMLTVKHQNRATAKGMQKCQLYLKGKNQGGSRFFGCIRPRVLEQ